MAERAQVGSVEAVDSFRAKLVVYISKARAGVDEVLDEIQRTQSWLDDEQRTYWERELRRRTRQLEEAEQELFSAKISRIRTQSAAQVLAVERARRAVRQAEEKKAALRKWSREFESRAEPLAKQIEQLLTFVTTDLSKATLHLGNVVKLLQDYAAHASEAPGLVGAPGANPETASSAETAVPEASSQEVDPVAPPPRGAAA